MVKFLALAAAAAMLLAGGSAARAATARVGALSISAPWIRPTPPGAPTAAGYLNIANAGTTADRLVGATTPAAASVEVHEMSMTGGIMKMRPVPGGLAIPPGGKVALAPGSYHLMLIGPKHRLVAGQSVMMTLIFQHAGKLDVRFPVANGADGKAGAAAGTMTMGAMPAMGTKPARAAKP
ncbi:MAG: copper chaperone PCu(A)C [Rhodospirillales bacterium]|nr:copper chaperone PCu(A)C [Rhodospirillales bacterium]